MYFLFEDIGNLFKPPRFGGKNLEFMSSSITMCEYCVENYG
jgi:hypothetical protein